MPTLTRRNLIALLLASPAVVRALGDDSGEWISLFDGASLEGWKASGPKNAFKAGMGRSSSKAAALTPTASGRPSTMWARRAMPISRTSSRVWRP